MRKRRCQRLQKVLHREIITLMAPLQQLVLPTEDSSFSHFADQREFLLQTSSFSLLRTAGSPLSFSNLLNFESTVSSGVTEPITVLTVVFILKLNTCRWSVVFSNCKSCSAYWGLDWWICRYVRPTQAGHPALIWWIWCGWIDSSIQHWLSMGSPFPELIKLHASVHEYGHGLINLPGGARGKNELLGPY